MKIVFHLSLLLVILSIPRCQDSEVNREIASQLSQSKAVLGLTYPKSVNRFFAEKEFRPIWIQDAMKPSRTWESMLLLDCVLQYGLSHEDYHQDELLYPKLREMMKDPTRATAKDKARLEIVLTDALLTFINDLHFGKVNPVFTRAKIDNGNIDGFSAERVLNNAFSSKDLLAVILDVQPKSKAYTELQEHMKLIRGQYLDDCYVVPETEVRKVAINTERLKWNDINARTYIQINIPSYTLTLQLPDTSFEFKVLVGKPTHPTPLVASKISYLGTAPDWKVPQEMFVNDVLPKAFADPNFLEKGHYTIYDRNGSLQPIDLAMLNRIKKAPNGFVARQSSGCELSLGRIAFHFPKEQGIYLYDGQEKKQFLAFQRAFTNSCVSVQNAEGLAMLLLKYDGQGMKTNEMLWNCNSKVETFLGSFCFFCFHHLFNLNWGHIA